MDCGTPESIPSGGFALASNATYYGTAVLYECEENYRLEGHARRLCLENGTWSGGLPTCRGEIVISLVLVSWYLTNSKVVFINQPNTSD